MVNASFNHQAPAAQANLLIQDLGVSDQRVRGAARIVEQLRSIHRLPWGAEKERNPDDQAKRNSAECNRQAPWSIDPELAAKSTDERCRGTLLFLSQQPLVERIGARSRHRHHNAVAERSEARSAQLELFALLPACRALIYVRSQNLCGAPLKFIFQVKQKKVG
jgi:hypothetical protein